MARPRFMLTTLLALTGAAGAALGLFVAFTGASAQTGWGRDPTLAALLIGAIILSGTIIGAVSERGVDRTLLQIGLSLSLIIALVRLAKLGSSESVDVMVAAIVFLIADCSIISKSAQMLRSGSHTDWLREATVTIFLALGGLLLAFALLIALWIVLALLAAIVTGREAFP